MWFWVHMIVIHWFPFITILKIFMGLLLMMYQYYLIFCKNVSLCSYFFFKQETVQNLFTSWYSVNFKVKWNTWKPKLAKTLFCDLFLPQVSTVQSQKDKNPFYACAWPTFTFCHLMFDFSTVRPADTPPPPVGWCHHIHTIWTCSSTQIILSVFYTLEHRFLNLLKNTSLKKPQLVSEICWRLCCL